VHLFRPSLGFLSEVQPRLKTVEDKRHFLAEVHIKFFRQAHELTGLQINLYLEQPMEIQLFATFFQRRK
jgi:hypothetical protein